MLDNWIVLYVYESFLFYALSLNWLFCVVAMMNLRWSFDVLSGLFIVVSGDDMIQKAKRYGICMF